MKILLNMAKMGLILGLCAAVIYGLYLIAKGQAPENRKRYQHPIHRAGGHW